MKINDSIGLSQNRLPIAKTNTSLLSGIPKHQNKLNIILVSILYVSNSKLHSRLTDTEAHSAEVATTVATATYRIGLPQVFLLVRDSIQCISYRTFSQCLHRTMDVKFAVSFIKIGQKPGVGL